jgi:hypothetical protein
MEHSWSIRGAFVEHSWSIRGVFVELSFAVIRGAFVAVIGTDTNRGSCAHHVDRTLLGHSTYRRSGLVSSCPAITGTSCVAWISQAQCERTVNGMHHEILKTLKYIYRVLKSCR